MINYNICFIKQGDRILLLNRDYPVWMGCWNGVGGKLEPDESPLESMKREIAEETNIPECKLTYKGLVTWMIDGTRFGGMYLYLGELPEDFQFATPVKTAEGILDWKAVHWILNPENKGISSNIPVFLERILNDPECYEHHCVYRDGKLVDHALIKIDSSTEELACSREYLAGKYAVNNH